MHSCIVHTIRRAEYIYISIYIHVKKKKSPTLACKSYVHVWIWNISIVIHAGMKNLYYYKYKDKEQRLFIHVIIFWRKKIWSGPVVQVQVNDSRSQFEGTLHIMTIMYNNTKEKESQREAKDIKRTFEIKRSAYCYSVQARIK